MKRRFAVACSLTFACAALAWRSLGLAADDALDLEWIAPAECPSRGDLLAELKQLVRGALPETTAERIRARVVLSHVGDADGPWRGVVTTFGDGAGERTLHAPSCRALADATALILALRVDSTFAARMGTPAPTIPEPRSTATMSPPSSASAATPLPSAVPPPPPPEPKVNPAEKPASSPPPEATASPPRLHHEFALGTSILGELGEMPSPAVGGEIVASWLAGRWRAELRAATGPVQNADVPGESGVGASLRAFSGGARGCYGILPFAVSVAGCALGELDWVWASGYAMPSATVRDVNAGWIALGGGALVVWRLGDRVSVRANLDAVAPLARPHFVTERPDGTFSILIYQPGAVIGRTGAGLEFHFL